MKTRTPMGSDCMRLESSPRSLIGQAQPGAVGRSGDGEGVRAPPAAAGQEADLEELAGTDRELLEVPPDEVDGDDVRRLAHDVGHAQAMAQREPDGRQHPVADEQAEGDYVEGDPVATARAGRRRGRSPSSPGAGRPARCPGRRRGAGRTRSRRRAAAARARMEVTATSTRSARPTVAMSRSQVESMSSSSSMTAPTALHRPAERGEGEVPEQQPQGPEAQPAVPGGQAVAADDVVDPGHACHQQDARRGPGRCPAARSPVPAPWRGPRRWRAGRCRRGASTCRRRRRRWPPARGRCQPARWARSRGSRARRDAGAAAVERKRGHQQELTEVGHGRPR